MSITLTPKALIKIKKKKKKKTKIVKKKNFVYLKFLIFY